MAEKINILWFRQDLRVADNPALTHAVESGRVLAVYILDQNDQGDHGPGAASRWWLHHSLNALNESLQGQLNIFRGDPKRSCRISSKNVVLRRFSGTDVMNLRASDETRRSKSFFRNSKLM